MNATVSRPMAKRKSGGRPKAEDGEQGTRQIRVFEDIADMLGWITRINEDQSTAQIIDPLVRDRIEAMYKRIEPDVNRIKQAEAKVQQIEEEVKSRQANN